MQICKAVDTIEITVHEKYLGIKRLVIVFSVI